VHGCSSAAGLGEEHAVGDTVDTGQSALCVQYSLLGRAIAVMVQGGLEERVDAVESKQREGVGQRWKVSGHITSMVGLALAGA
jgi:hypothetical protein